MKHLILLQAHALGNPLAEGQNTFSQLFATIYNEIVFPVAVPFVALAFMYCGFLFIVAHRQNSRAKLKVAKNTFKYTLLGTAILLCGFAIANLSHVITSRLVENSWNTLKFC